MLTRKRCGCHAITGAVALVLLVALSACAREEPVRIASHVWVGYEPMFLARSLGWLDEALVTLQETASASESMAALTAGQVDGAALTLDEVLQLREQGVDLTVVLVFNVSVGADVILARPPIATLADLAGRRVAFEHGAVGELMIVEALRQAGLTRADIEAVDLSANEQATAYSDGMVDAVVTYEPAASLLQAEGAISLFDSSEIPEYIVDVLAVRSDRLGSGRVAALEHLVGSHLRALEYFLRNPQDAAYRMAERLGLPPAEVLSAYRGLVLPDLAGNYRLLQGDAASLREAAQALVLFKVEQGLLSEKNDLGRLLSARFLPPLVR
ncbi:ABC transporter substrate-binding protein [Wenzhouxiangella limi]|uniref:ABC transporter substrate-binding protein n=1 Tax=Wenzhouxiangella limi TaxID=2707351 RepID=A0A845V7C7_9GAMM|nr:ABC transporter substrate-binding protein [Wenzhouxiangella limi]NDY97056.1 ABC transporter substrate-binding protein [Wenzhouxiangella limi]